MDFIFTEKLELLSFRLPYQFFCYQSDYIQYRKPRIDICCDMFKYRWLSRCVGSLSQARKCFSSTSAEFFSDYFLATTTLKTNIKYIICSYPQSFEYFASKCLFFAQKDSPFAGLCFLAIGINFFLYVSS